MDNEEDFKEGQTKGKDFILRVYDNVIDANDPLNDFIVREREKVGLEETESCSRVGVGATYEASLNQNDLSFSDRRSLLEEKKEEVTRRHVLLLKKIESYAADIDLQESKRKAEVEAIRTLGVSEEGHEEGEREEKRLTGNEERVKNIQKSLQDLRETKVEEMKQRSLEIKNLTISSRDTVKAYSIYKDHVLSAVECYSSEAVGSVEQLIARFRDLLTLRCELSAKITNATEQLERVKDSLQKAQKEGHVKAGEALLALYSRRLLTNNNQRKIQQMNNKLQTLKENSSSYNSMLAQIQVAISNMYSIARLYQRSLPPVSSSSSECHSSCLSQLRLLHNFLCDATSTIRAAEQSEKIDSTVVTVGSVATA